MNPRGGEFAGALAVKYNYQYLPTVLVPQDKVFFGSGTLTDYSQIGIFDGGRSLWINFSPPGAANLPVKLVIMPGLFSNIDS